MSLSSGDQADGQRHVLVTLGSVALIDSVSGAVVLGPGKPVALLTYLACTPARTASREHLIELLWADADPDRARHALRQTLWQIRLVLGDSAFSGKEEVALAAPLGIDRDRFLELIEADDLVGAVSAYAGAFMPSFASPGGAAFERWADIERERLASMFVRAVERLVRRQLASGDFRYALTAARRLIMAGNAPGIGHRLAIEAYLALGDGISAEAEAGTLEEWSRQEDVALDPATRAVINRARQRASALSDQHTPASSTGGQLTGELVGREEQFARVIEAWNGVRAGHPGHVHLVAGAGLGKTRLLRDLETRLLHSGVQVRYLRAHPGDRDMPGAMVSELARALATLPGAKAVAHDVAAVLVALDPSLANIYDVTADPSTGHEAHRRRTLALVELMRATSEEGRYALLLDDLHWADRESFGILESVLARREGTQYLLVTATRPVPDKQLRTEGRLLINLPPLTAGQVGQLVASIGRLPGDAALDDLPAALTSGTGGNPLFIMELLELARERGALILQDDHWVAADHVALTELLREGQGIRERLTRLSTESMNLMLALAMAGTPILVTAAADAAGIPLELAQLKLEVLERQGLAQRTGVGWETVHDEIAAAVREVARDDAHIVQRRLAASLEASGDDIRAIACWQALADLPAMTRIVARRIERGRISGRQFDPRRVIGELLGYRADPELVQSITRALPWRLRRRPLPRIAAIVAAAATIVVATGATWRWVHPSGDIVTFDLVWWQPDGSYGTRAVRIDPRRWTEGAPIDAEQLSAPSRLLGANLDLMPGAFPSGRDSIVTSGLVNGSVEVVLATRAGATALTSDPRDDLAPSVSPDGREVFFMTARWSPPGGDSYDIARLTMAAPGRVIPVIRSVRSEFTPVPSPDGTRIAFLAASPDGASRELCTAAYDGSQLRCWADRALLDRVVAWLDLDHVLLQADSAGARQARRIDVRNGVAEPILPLGVHAIRLDRSREWIACICDRSSDGTTSIYLAHADAPTRGRWVRNLDDNLPRTIIHRLRQHPGDYLERLQVNAPAVLTSATYQLGTTGYDRDGSAVPFDVSTVRWSARPESVARIDSLTGVVSAVAPGRATIVASAGGWRRDSVTVEVSSDAIDGLATLLLDEPWDALDRWRPFGVPPARVGLTASVERAMLPSGDGSYPSGAYSTMAFATKRGLTLEAMVSTPRNAPIWQTLQVGFTTLGDRRVLARWDHRTAEPPSERDATVHSCAVAYPAGEGTAVDTIGMLNVRGPRRSFRVADAQRTGTPTLWRVTIFPDGSCGVAIGGVPMARSPAGAIRGDSVRVWIAGHSVNTTVAVGRLRVWAGDPGGVGWARAMPR